MNKIVKVCFVGRTSYQTGLQLQKYVADLHHKLPLDSVKDTLLIVEHSPVYTVGIRTKNYTEADEKYLKGLGADFYKTNRGGLITFHGPGQLVVYPILNLKNFQPSIKWYVCQIEKTIIEFCKKYYGIHATTSPHTGVWIGDNKLCAIGLHASRYITSHGLALNCNVDLRWFDHIVPCGIEDKGVTSLSQVLQRNVTVEEVVPYFLKAFSHVFNCSCLDYTQNEVVNILANLDIQTKNVA